MKNNTSGTIDPQAHFRDIFRAHTRVIFPCTAGKMFGDHQPDPRHWQCFGVKRPIHSHMRYVCGCWNWVERVLKGDSR